MNQHDQILDPDGENQAVRCFLLHYQNPGVSIGALRNALRRSGFDGCWPDWVNGRETSESITKAGAQLWIRHLFSLEQTLSHVNETPKNEHDSGDVLNKSGNVHVMREALLLCQQADLKKYILNTGETLAQVIDKALATEPAPLRFVQSDKGSVIVVINKGATVRHAYGVVIEATARDENPICVADFVQEKDALLFAKLWNDAQATPTEPAPLVRLNDDALVNIYLECKAEWKATNKRQRQRIAVMFGNAIMAAMQERNK